MVLTAVAILFPMFFLFRSLQRNVFFMLHVGMVILFSYYAETYLFKVSPFIYKTFFLLLIFHLISINIITFFAYYFDKRAAKKNQYRVSEKNLHMLEILGGNIGAFLGQKIFRHKIKKKEFITLFWLICLLQIFLICFLWNYLGLSLKDFI